MGSGDNVEIDPTYLTKGANDLQVINDHLTSILTTMTNSLDSRGEPWGADSIGTKFAGGSNGYLSSMAVLVKGGTEMGSTLDDFVTGLENAAQTVAQNEQTVVDSFDKS